LTSAGRRYGDPLPPTLASIPVPSSSAAHERHDADDFVRREIDWIAVPLKEKKPFLGICLGAR